MAVIALLVVATLGGWAGIGTAVLLHEGSTMVVVLNSLRLLMAAGPGHRAEAAATRMGSPAPEIVRAGAPA